MDRRAVRVAAVVALMVGLAAPAVAHAADRHKPSASELWRAYPLKPTVTATASAASTSAAPTPARRPARAAHAHGTSWLPFGLVALALAAGAGVWLVARRRTRAAPAAPAGPAAAPAPAAALWRRRSAPPAARRPREPAWPWPPGLDDAWRCEIALAPAALSARVEAVVHEPGGGSRTLLAASPTGPGGPNWQSSEALDEAVAALAGELEAHGWEPVAGGPPHTRRLCWPHAGDPFARAEEAAWTA